MMLTLMVILQTSFTAGAATADTPMEHRNLWLAYAFVLAVQAGYALWTAVRWNQLKSRP
jgi:hypothetical protein